MQKNQSLIIFFLFTMCFFIGAPAQPGRFSISRRHQDQHKLLGIKGQWTGDDCDDECHQANGQVCGRVWKECCPLGCEGVVQISCKQDKFIPESQMKCFKLDNSKETETSNTEQKSQQASKQNDASKQGSSKSQSSLTPTKTKYVKQDN